MKAPKDYPSLFGYISPATGDVTTHPPLCACGSCAMPVERFACLDCDCSPCVCLPVDAEELECAA